MAVVDPGFRGVDEGVFPVKVIHRGKHKTLLPKGRRWLKRGQAIGPVIGHTKSGNRMERCWPKGALGDALHAPSCAAGYNIRRLLRAIVRLGIKPAFLRPLFVALIGRLCINSLLASLSASRTWFAVRQMRWGKPESGFVLA